MQPLSDWSRRWRQPDVGVPRVQAPQEVSRLSCPTLDQPPSVVSRWCGAAADVACGIDAMAAMWDSRSRGGVGQPLSRRCGTAARGGMGQPLAAVWDSRSRWLDASRPLCPPAPTPRPAPRVSRKELRAHHATPGLPLRRPGGPHGADLEHLFRRTARGDQRGQFVCILSV